MKNIDQKKQSHSQTVSQSRRRLAKSAAITPVFMTLLNRPVWGAAKTMCTVSGFESAVLQGGIASGVDTSETCNNVHGQNYWASNTPAGFDKNTEKFNTVFSATLTDDPTFQTVLSSGNTFDKNFAGLYLDELTSGVSPFGESVVDVYTGLTSTGFYTFADGLVWSSSEFDLFIDYLHTHAP